MDKNNFLIKGFLESPNHPSLKVRMDNAESELIDFKNDLLADTEDEYTPEELDKMSPFQLLEARLRYEGICNYTAEIMHWVIQVIGLGLESHEIQKLGIDTGDFYD